MRKFLSSLFLLMLLFGFSKAQDRRISGIVTDAADGAPLPGVSVMLKGTSAGTQTQVDGRFTIPVSGNNPVLVFTYIGYASKEVTVGGNTSLTITLNTNTNQLNEVTITVPYGTTTRATNTGSLTQINSEDFAKRPITNVLSSVVGSGPGISTTIAGGAPGDSPGIRIRGFGSINASSSALIVVDGAVYDGTMSNINPDDVESVTLLKDAATTALYGSRASNGVVQIITKKGKANKPTLNFKATQGWISRGLPEYDRVNAYQYYPLMWEAQRNSLVYGTSKVPVDVANNIASGITTSYGGATYSGIKSLLGYNPFNVLDNQIVLPNGTLNSSAQLLYPDDLDWADQATQGGKQRQNYSLTYSGGSDKSNYFGSFGYTREQGYLIKSDLQRYNARLNVDNQATKWFKTGINLTGNYTNSQFDNAGDGGTSIVNPFYISRYIGPIYPVHLHNATTGELVLDANGQSQYDVGSLRPFAQGRHTIFENLNDSQNLIRGAINSRAYAAINFYKDLKFTTDIAFDLQDSHERDYDNPFIGDGAPAGRGYQYLYRTTTYTFRQLLEYSKSFGKHHIEALIGHENYSYKYNYLSGAKSGVIIQGITELVNFSSITTSSSYEDNATLESILSRVNYNFDEKYLISANLRRDGSSKFAPGVRWANFYGLGLGWNINRESFFNASWVDLLKLRSSYGELGNSNLGSTIGNYPYQALYLLGRNNAAEAGFTQSSLPNSGFTWESLKSFDAGVDFSLFKGRLSGSLEYYNRVTDGLIFSVPISLSNGGTTGTSNYNIPTNVGSMYNRGVELQLNGQAVKKRNFEYSVGLNLTTIKNKITKMPDQNPLIQSGTKAWSVGHSQYDFYLREYYGVDPQTGAALYKTNTLTSNARVIGQDTVTTVVGEANYRYASKSSIPDLQGSMSHNFSYKNFSLAFQFTFQLGGRVYDSQYAGLMHSGTYGTALSTDMLKRWQNPGDVTDIPRLDNAQVTNLSAGSTRWLTKASYLQLNSVNFSYNLPKSLVGKIKAQRAYVFASAENLALFTARKGMNTPGSFNGTTDNTYNFNRIISAGINVNF
jgi:TonB-linked SusC/RagA family outer membrane protein